MLARSLALVAGAACLGGALLGGCKSPRPRVGTARGDGGPAVVYVDRPEAPGTPGALGAADGIPLVDEREPNDRLESAQPFEFPKGIRGTVAAPAGKAPAGKAAADVDVFQWVAQVEGPRTARVELRGPPGQALSLEVLDGEGQRIASGGAMAEGAGWAVPDVAVEPGKTYYLRVAGRPGTGAATAAAAVPGKAPGQAPGQTTDQTTETYGLTLTLAGAALAPGEVAEPSGDAAHAVAVPLGTDASGYFGAPRDEDWIRIEAPAEVAPGSVLRLELDGVEGVVGVLRVLDGAGARLSEARGAKGQPLVLRNAPLPGPGGGYVVVRAESGSSSELRWLLRMRVEATLPGDEVEPDDTVAQAALLGGGEGQAGGAEAGEGAKSGRGYLWPGDTDLWKLPLEQPGLVRATLAPPAGSRAQLRLELVDAARDRALASAEASAPGASVELAPWYVARGPVLLRVSARRDAPSDAPYQIGASLLPAEGSEHEPNDAAASATPLDATGGSVRGWLATRGDEDWYELGAPPARSRVTVNLGAPAGVKATVRLVDGANRKPLGPPGASASAVVSGPCYVVVQSASGSAGSREPYTLEIGVAPDAEGP